MDRHAQVVMPQLAIMNHRLIMLHEEVQARQSGGSKVSWSMHGYLQTELVLEAKTVAPTLGEHLA